MHPDPSSSRRYLPPLTPSKPQAADSLAPRPGGSAGCLQGESTPIPLSSQQRMCSVMGHPADGSFGAVVCTGGDMLGDFGTRQPVQGRGPRVPPSRLSEQAARLSPREGLSAPYCCPRWEPVLALCGVPAAPHRRGVDAGPPPRPLQGHAELGPPMPTNTPWPQVWGEPAACQ